MPKSFSCFPSRYAGAELPLISSSRRCTNARKATRHCALRSRTVNLPAPGRLPLGSACSKPRSLSERSYRTSAVEKRWPRMACSNRFRGRCEDEGAQGCSGRSRRSPRCELLWGDQTPSIRFSVEVGEKKKEGVSENLLPRHGQKGVTPNVNPNRETSTEGCHRARLEAIAEWVFESAAADPGRPAGSGAGPARGRVPAEGREGPSLGLHGAQVLANAVGALEQVRIPRCGAGKRSGCWKNTRAMGCRKLLQ